MKYLILVSGHLQTGKNELSKYLVEDFKNRNLSVKNDMFAKNVKDWCKEDFKPIVEYLNNYIESLKVNLNSLFDLNNDSLSHYNNMLSKLQLKDENFYEDKTDLSRLMLQIYGTDIFRYRVDNDWWAKQLRKRVLESTEDVIVVTDVRFPNEILTFYDDCINMEELKVIAIRVERNKDTEEFIASHVSETALDDWKEWNYIVQNNGTLEDLRGTSKVITEDILSNVIDELCKF